MRIEDVSRVRLRPSGYGAIFDLRSSIFNIQDRAVARRASGGGHVSALSALMTANTSQEQALTNLPPSTEELYLNKGRAYLLLKKLVRAGRRSFAARPAAAAEFNLDILNRKGTQKKDSAETSAATP